MTMSRALYLGALVGLLAAVLGGGYLLFAGDTAPRRVPTIGIVHIAPKVNDATIAGFKAGMADLGYREGEGVRYHYTGPAGGIDRLDALVAGQIAAGVDLIYVISTPGTLAVKRATKTIPAVFGPVNDPVKSGVVASLRAPGGNITGVRLPEGDKLRLQWLLRLTPGVRKVLFPYNPADKSALESLRQVQEASGALGVELVPQPVADAAAIRAGLARIPAGVDAIFLPRDSLVESRIQDYADAALRQRLPLCAPSLDLVQDGALLAYGFGQREIGEQAARLAVQILRGQAPGELPVETAQSYLAVNLKTARALGIAVPDDILRQAHTLVR